MASSGVDGPFLFHPALGCGVTDALKSVYLPKNGAFGTDYLPSRINWVVQSSGVDYLHLLIIGMEYLIKKYDIKARYMGEDRACPSCNTTALESRH
jgi:hypothetical protein